MLRSCRGGVDGALGLTSPIELGADGGQVARTAAALRRALVALRRHALWRMLNLPTLVKDVLRVVWRVGAAQWG